MCCNQCFCNNVSVHNNCNNVLVTGYVLLAFGEIA